MVILQDDRNEPMLDMFIFETSQLLEQLEQIIIGSDSTSRYDQENINEIFRIMHTIKGSSAMMGFDNISKLTHSAEDLFSILRDKKQVNEDFTVLSDVILESADFIKAEILKIDKRNIPDGDASPYMEKVKSILAFIKGQVQSTSGSDIPAADGDYMLTGCMEQPEDEGSPDKRSFRAVIRFEEGCGMECMRAYALVHSLSEFSSHISHIPEELNDTDESNEIIKKDGFQVCFRSELSYEEIYKYLSKTIFLKDLMLADPAQAEETVRTAAVNDLKDVERDARTVPAHHNLISVNVGKLDKLMDLVGELVISESMVTQNPGLSGLALENFRKAARQHRKIINELQDVAMSIRMVPLSSTFQKMNRIVRDMSKKLNKNVKLIITGEETEVDKNIIEHISDPLMHIIRNSVDHGIESPEERRAKGKAETGTITLEAKNAGGDVLIIVKDDGRGLDKARILDKARENGLIGRHEGELLDREIYSYIFLPGFSTKENTTEFSGRGVGMDVVTRNISAVGGNVSVASLPGEGTTFTVKIPLTLAIMDGMTIRVGKTKYTIPIASIRESFKALEKDVIIDPENNEMIMIRGQCYPILRLHEIYKVATGIVNISDGIVIMAENEGKGYCIFADELIGQQQVVVKTLPDYIKNLKKVRGVAGCTLLGDGSISLILDTASLLNY